MFETVPGAVTIRDMFEISSTAGMIEFQREIAAEKITLIADWPGIWLSGAAIAALALVLFVLLFPSTPASETTS